MNKTTKIQNLVSGIKLLSCEIDVIRTNGSSYYD